MGTPRLVDVSHTVEHGTVACPGLPGSVICDCLSHSNRWRRARSPRWTEPWPSQEDA